MTKINVLDKGFVQLLDNMGDDSAIVETARISYLGTSSGDASDRRLINTLMKNGHTSPFEQVEFRFLVKAPIFIARQWMRHRAWSYSEKSMRYTSKETNEYYIPEIYEGKPQEQIWIDCIENSISTYEKLLTMDVPKEKARCVLPVGIYTKFYAKVDLHNLLHFLDLRLASGAQEEMIHYASALLELIRPIVPMTIEAWLKNKKENG